MPNKNKTQNLAKIFLSVIAFFIFLIGLTVMLIQTTFTSAKTAISAVREVKELAVITDESNLELSNPELVNPNVEINPTVEPVQAIVEPIKTQAVQTVKETVKTPVIAQETVEEVKPAITIDGSGTSIEMQVLPQDEAKPAVSQEQEQRATQRQPQRGGNHDAPKYDPNLTFNGEGHGTQEEFNKNYI